MSSFDGPTFDDTPSGKQHPEKNAVARKTTFVSIAVNSVLIVLQMVVGTFAHSQALVADGVHSLADLVSDFVVLIANRQGSAAPDADHNYGHNRYETIASLFLGALLLAVGVGMLVRGGVRLADPDAIVTLHASALVVALVVILSKETLFRYMLHEAHRVRSTMLIANAWHARSDAASSLVVALGIMGNLAGVRLLDPIAAAIVGFMVARMGWRFMRDALRDLSDRALGEAATADLRALLLATPGVKDIHELRTRKAGDLALVDAHILVAPRISVSEGHYIAEAARARLRQDARVLDALIHVDPENDLVMHPPLHLPSRETLTAQLEKILAGYDVRLASVTLHYLSTGLEVGIWVADEQDALKMRAADLDEIARKVGAVKVEVVKKLTNNK